MDPAVWEGRFIRVRKAGRWEYVQRTNASAVVAITAVTEAGELVLVEQYRPPVARRVIELPAGLAGDLADAPDEDTVLAAARELHEETGFEAEHWKKLGEGPVSAGLSDEVIEFWGARGLRRAADGGGDDSEDIVIHLVPRDGLNAFLDAALGRGALVDPKIMAGLYMYDRVFVRTQQSGPSRRNGSG